MKCVIPGQNVKFFGKSIHCLSKIGDELFFEALEDGLALRTVNSSRSAYACFIFNKSFLGEYDQGADQIDGSNPTELLKCKVTMKSVLAIFKSLTTIEKIVDRCKIVFQPDRCRLVFILHCKHGIVKTHNLTYQECESLQAVFGKEFCPNNITAQHKVLQDTVSNFPTSCEEITLSVCPEHVKITNYIDDEPDRSKVVHTVMTLAPEEFDYFRIGIDTKVTFCLKELRAILAFSEYVNQPLSLHFEQAGRPIVFSFESDDLYVGDFVMATLSENDAPTQSSQQLNASQESRDNRNLRENWNTTSREKPAASNNKPLPSITNKGATSCNNAVPKRNHNEKNTVQNTRKTNDQSKRTIQDTSSVHSILKDDNGRGNSSKKQIAPMTRSSIDIHNPADDFFSESFPFNKSIFDSATSTENREQSQRSNDNNQRKTAHGVLSKRNQRKELICDEHTKRTKEISEDESSDRKRDFLYGNHFNQNKQQSKDVPPNRSIFDRSTNMDDVSAVMTDDEEDGDVLGGTPPPAKKKMFKSIFFGDSGSNVSVMNSQRNNSQNRTVLLAADTDDEDD